MSEENAEPVSKIEMDQEEAEKQEDQEKEANLNEGEDPAEQKQGDQPMPSTEADTPPDDLPVEPADSDEKSTASTEADNDTETAAKDPMELIAEAVNHKDEGNNLFKSGDLTKASRSYRKGTSLLKTLNKFNDADDQVKALLISLQTNLSMVCFKQSKYAQSRDVATKALDVDATNVKALYRRAVASRKIGDVDAAKKDLKLALQCDADNRAVKKELLSIKKQLDDEKKTKKAALAKAFSSKGGSFLYDDKEELEKKRAEEKKVKEEAEKKAREKRKADWEDVCVERMSKGEDAITFEDYEKDLKKKEEDAEKARKKAKKEEEDRKKAERRAKKKEMKKADPESSDDELTEKELQMLRGYKKTSDGRTTSYFNREQTEAEKKLLGDIAPQRLNTSFAPQRLDSTASVSSKSSSVWNQAGTWEEKDTSEWCNTTLTNFLMESNVEVDGYTGRVDKVKDLSGDASVAFVSGKKRYVFDYHASLKFAILDEGDDKVASGTIKLPDMSSTAINDELEVDVSWKKAPSDEHADSASHCQYTLVDKVRSQVLAFVNAFNAQY